MSRPSARSIKPSGALEILAGLFNDSDGLVRGYTVAAFGNTAKPAEAGAARPAKLVASDTDPFVRLQASKVSGHGCYLSGPRLVNKLLDEAKVRDIAGEA